MDIFIGVLANAGLVILGSLCGIIFRKIKVVDRIGERILQAFGIFVMVMGIQGTNLEEPVKYLVCLMIGITIGELLDIDKRFKDFGDWVQRKIPNKGEESLSHGMITASLIFCIGSMTFLGAIESGLSHSHTIYIAKGIIDAVTALTLAVGLGWGVMLSAGCVLVYQGMLVVLAAALGELLLPATISMCVSVGSLMLVIVGLNLLGITKIKVANMLPAMFVPMILQLF